MKHPFDWNLPPRASKSLLERLGRQAMFSLRRKLEGHSPTPDEEIIIMNDPKSDPGNPGQPASPPEKTAEAPPRNPPGDAQSEAPPFVDPEPAPPIPPRDGDEGMAMEARSGGPLLPTRPAFAFPAFPDAFTRSTVTVNEALARVQTARADLRLANEDLDHAHARVLAAEKSVADAETVVDEAMGDSVDAVEAHRLVVEKWLAKHADYAPAETEPVFDDDEDNMDEAPAL